jgi:hypothetical protein
MRAAPLFFACLFATLGCDPSNPIMSHHDGGRPDGAADTGIVPGTDSGLDPHLDTDGDTISDNAEGAGSIDTDRDGTPDTMDTDSDGDGLTDAMEAGDTDVLTRPVDTDGDGTPDFRDLDSDGDGLSDALEIGAHTSPTDADSDHDGIGDLVEVAAMTDPNDPTDNPRANGDFFFLEPYMAPPSPTRDTLVFATNIQRADVFFMIDTSISMQSYIDTIRTSLTTTIIPGVAAAIPDVHFGVGQFDICPTAAAGHTPAMCVGIQVDQISTGNTTAVGNALMGLTADCSGVHEPYAQSIVLWASGADPRWPTAVAPACAHGVGLGCMRRDALPILLVIGDERFTESYNQSGTACGTTSCMSCATYPTVTEIITQVNRIAGRVMQLGPASMASPMEWGMIATGTGAVDAAGMPLIFPTAGSATVDMAVVNAIRQLAMSTPLDITAVARDDTSDTIDALAFISRIETNNMPGIVDPRDPTRICMGGLTTADRDMNGVLETFVDVRPGTPVCFDIVPAMNTTVMPAAMPILVHAFVDVLGDGVTVLDTRDVYFLVPPAIAGPS